MLLKDTLVLVNHVEIILNDQHTDFARIAHVAPGNVSVIRLTSTRLLTLARTPSRRIASATSSNPLPLSRPLVVTATWNAPLAAMSDKPAPESLTSTSTSRPRAVS